MKRFLVLAVVMATGCAEGPWARPGASADQARADLEACNTDAYREANAKPFPYPTMGPVIVQDSTARRFNADGGTFADPDGSRYTRERRLAAECMRKKGYERSR